jgi:hypothetical protein
MYVVCLSTLAKFEDDGMATQKENRGAKLLCSFMPMLNERMIASSAE